MFSRSEVNTHWIRDGGGALNVITMKEKQDILSRGEGVVRHGGNLGGQRRAFVNAATQLCFVSGA